MVKPNHPRPPHRLRTALTCRSVKLAHIAAEARAKILYERLINVTDDVGVRNDSQNRFRSDL